MVQSQNAVKPQEHSVLDETVLWANPLVQLFFYFFSILKFFRFEKIPFGATFFFISVSD